MKKKTLVLIASCILLMFALCACNGSDTDKDHVHQYGEWETVAAATCIQSGEERRTCECGESEKQEIPKIPHAYGMWMIATEATCGVEGEEKRTCFCGAFETQKIPATGMHTYGEWQTTVEAICHKEGEEKRVCACGVFESQKLPIIGDHTFVNNVCSRCGSRPGSVGLQFWTNTDKSEYMVHGIGTCTDTDIVIPTLYQGLPVTKIDNRAFEDYDRMTSVTLQDGLRHINGQAFAGCDGLTSIRIPDSVVLVDYEAFINCSNLSEIILPDTSIVISHGVFDNTKYYSSSSNWDNGVLYVGNHLIEVDASSTGEYHIKTGTKTIASHAFRECKNVTSITFPDGVLYIGSSAFFDCKGLTSIILPEGLVKIDFGAFHSCTGLVSVTLPNSLKAIGSEAFYHCKNLMSIRIPEGVTVIAPELFYGCSELSDVTIPNGVTNIEIQSFYGCESLAAICIPDGVKKIGKKAFYGCSALTRLVVPNSVIEIGSGAFEGCDNLISISIPFVGLRRDKGQNLGAIFGSWDSIINHEYVPAALRHIAITDEEKLLYHEFYRFENITSLALAKTVKSINPDAFEGCKSLETIYYEGTIKNWQDIEIESSDTVPFSVVKIYFYSETQPTEAGNYWYYVDGVPTEW